MNMINNPFYANPRHVMVLSTLQLPSLYKLLWHAILTYCGEREGHLAKTLCMFVINNLVFTPGVDLHHMPISTNLCNHKVTLAELGRCGPGGSEELNKRKTATSFSGEVGKHNQRKFENYRK